MTDRITSGMIFTDPDDDDAPAFKLRCLYTDRKQGRVISIGGRREHVVLRITPTGLVRVETSPAPDPSGTFTLKENE